MPNTQFDFAENLTVAINFVLDGSVNTVVQSDSDVTVALRLPLDGDIALMANVRLDDPISMITPDNDEMLDFYPVNSVNTYCSTNDGSADASDALTTKIMTALNNKGVIGDLHVKAKELGMGDYVHGFKDVVVPTPLRGKFGSVDFAVNYIAERYNQASTAIFAVRILSSYIDE